MLILNRQIKVLYVFIHYLFRKIIDGIYKKNKDLTIISIAHRKEALKYCNKIIELSNGAIINELNS